MARNAKSIDERINEQQKVVDNAKQKYEDAKKGTPEAQKRKERTKKQRTFRCY